MTPIAPLWDQWPVLSPLLDEALDLPPSEHGAWLARLTGERAMHREALRALLAHRSAVETDDFLVQGPSLDQVSEAPGIALAEGTQIGAYRLISEIGRGGMGTVWLAERSDGMMKRRVALKLPRAVWGDAFAERLGREREILASLEHAHIARLYDAGVDAQGRPFLAMEFVEGEAIDSYCRAHSLPVHERLALLLQVMAAVAHAHTRLVVHRDLKPGNILVTRDAQVKLLDFGIAKLLEGDRTRGTALTELTGRALTPDYASPEQIRGEPIGTPSDVYSLAVVAYELLSGARPYRLKRGTAAELEEAIASAEAPLASTMAADPQLARQLRGDLDAILNKALKKTAGERYPTMDAFAQDLRRWLDGEPVEAQPDRLRYRAAKFVGRHRLQVAAGALVTLALVAGASIAAWQAREARLSAEQARTDAAKARVEAATAKAVQGFIESVFNANTRYQADPNAAGNTTARELLNRGAERIDKELASEPEARLRLLDLLAQMSAGVALQERGLVLYRRAFELATQLHGPQSDAALSAATNIGGMLDDLGRRDEALAMLLQADAAASQRSVDRDAIRMHIDKALAHVYFYSDLPKALERARRAAAIARLQGPSEDGTMALYVLGDVARPLGHLEEARQALEEAARWVDRLGAEGVLPNILASLGTVQNELGLLDAAGTTMTRAIALAERLGDADALHAARYALARFQSGNSLLREALDTASPELAWARSSQGDPAYQNMRVLTLANFGRSLVAYGDAARGLMVLDEARALLPPQMTARLGQVLAARADALVALGRLPEAGVEVERAVVATAQSGDRVVQSVQTVRRRYLVAIGKADEALRSLSDNPLPSGEASTSIVLLRRQAETAMLLLAVDNRAAASKAAASGLATLEKLPQRRFLRDAEARMTAVLGETLLRDGKPAEALPVLEKSLALHLVEYDPVHSPAVANAWLALARARRAVGDPRAREAEQQARRVRIETIARR